MLAKKMNMKNFAKRIVVSGLAASLILGSSGDVLASVPEVNIASGPLFSGRGNVHPNMLLNLSVEYPTVGAAYRGTNDYNKAIEYLGYFNPVKCYTYPTPVTSTAAVYGKVLAGSGADIYPNLTSGGIAVYTTLDTATGTLSGFVGYINGTKSGRGTIIRSTNSTDATGSTLVTPATNIPTPVLDDNNLINPIGYFSISKTADTNHECGGDSFSGNFMNWAASSSIDMLRYAMTGGDRTSDTTTLTVLQRAWLPDGNYNSNSNFYANGTYFPRKSVTSPASVTPFSATTLYVVSCRNRILFSNTNGGGNCDTARISGNPGVLQTTDKYFGEYLARVKVCDSNDGPTRTDLCQKYGANYKPVGELQKNADKLRVGALGYLTEHDIGNNNVYGGVVRGPVKYVGPKKFDSPSFAETTNDKPEWDATTGVFYNNPEDAANRTSTTNSGVINYLNKFGRTNASRPGAYKTWDPVGELYYEAISYLQGKQPTSGSTNGTSATRALTTDTLDDNFTVLKTWVDPVTASCQNNYIVTIGDVNTHQDAYIPGSPARNADAARTAETATTTTPAFNALTWTKLVSDMEVDASSTYGNLAKRSGLSALDTKNTGAGTGTYYMAGMAYWANTNDIRLDKPVRVKTFSIDVDEGGNGSIEDTNPRGIKPRNSQLYLAAKYGGFLDKNKDGNPYKTYAEDGVTVVNNNKEWSSNSTDPDNYFLASNPAKMIGSIKNIFQVVSSSSGTISGVTLTSTKISTDSSYVYQPGFDPSKWSGNLLKLQLQLVDGAVTIPDAKFSVWDAGLILTGKEATTTPLTAAVPASPTPDARKIYTAQINADRSLTTIPFKWTNLTTDQKILLNKSPVTLDPDTLGEKRVNYLRGSRVDEIGYANGIFRQRDRILGDIINSNPTYVGAPASNIRGDGYEDFYNADAQKNRTKAVYVGANDGMLHAFNAIDGVELFAYVPNAVIDGLNKLTGTNYVHQPYVDGTLTVKEAKIGEKWKTILASGMGGGAQGLFVLDVTNPADFAGGAGAIWEFTDKDDVDMGNLTTAPQIAKFRIGVDANTKAPVYKYFIVVPSGLNNYRDDGHSNFGKPEEAEGALFLLSLDKNSSDAWSEGTNYYKFKTPVKVATLQNGLSSPALVEGNDGAVSYAYAGDLQGNLWRFDFTGDAPANGKSSTTPLFTAKIGTDNFQPITQQPKVVFAPNGGYLILFGTGKYVEDADAAPGNFKTQSFYGIYDTTDAAYVVSRSTDLEVRTLAKDPSSDAVTITGNKFNYGVASPFKKGWYLDFLGSGSVNGTGERSVTDSLVTYGRLFFNSLITGSDPCATGGGRTYGLGALTGLPLNSDGVSSSGAITGQTSTVGMLSSPVLFETGTTVGDRDSVGKRIVSKKISVVNFGTGGKDGTAAPAQNGKKTLTLSSGRMSWREILNWQDLHQKASK